MPFSPPVLGLLQLLSAHPGGVSRQAAVLELGGAAPGGVERALARLLELGVVEARGDLVVPLPPLLPLAVKMERLARRISRPEAQRDQAMDLVRIIMRGP
ncbi:hypothetical protein LCGC14_0938700 [marine sediment metagenome]|uniref:Uncharacterized protein n=1 Tax=marine sediment metagenome TaxID=412755 RepID=A0A0F9P6U3_9ZZZZ